MLNTAQNTQKRDLDKPKYIRILVYPLYLYKNDDKSDTRRFLSHWQRCRAYGHRR
jgi:hypothetical protein